MNLEELQFLLKQYGLTPNKVRGQNFLVSDQVLDDIMIAADIKLDDIIVEVGPGLGALTQRLVAQAEQVTAFEIDKNFEIILNRLKKVNKNLEIIWQDILSVTDQQLPTQDYKIVANIPYYLTGKFMQKFLTVKNLPQAMILMVQQEVANRILVKDGKQSLLSLSVAFYARAEIVKKVDKNDFYPVPKVDSAVIKIDNIHTWQYKVEEKKVWQLIKRGMSHKRKKLLNNLLTDQEIDKVKINKVFEELGLDKNIRAEKLSIENWIDLTKSL
jgi:16S rRNA (adenine1518-N6/adenine1519-N6)-dimethyltransferase